MADTTTPVETATPPVVKNEVTTPAAPTAPVVEDKAQDTAVEELKKQLQQQEMRANQLANQLKAKEEAEAATQAKELEENNQFKELFEQEKAKNESLTQEQETKEKQAELDTKKSEALEGYSDEVKGLAEEVGLTLLDTDEKSVESFKEKLEKISAKVSSEVRVTPNNPAQPNTDGKPTSEQLREALFDDKDGTVFHDIVTKNYPGIAAMTGKSK